jgi:hypothetical protein
LGGALDEPRDSGAPGAIILFPPEALMKRWITWSAAAACVALAAPVMRADVKTSEKSTVKFAGMMGAIINRMAGGSDGITTTVAVKGNRMSEIMGRTGRIVDLGEEKVYALDMRKKEYRVRTFAEMRAELEKARADAEKQAEKNKTEEAPAPEQPDEQLAVDVDVKETGQHKTVLDYDTREVIVTLTLHEKGKKVEDSGGLIMTSTMWLAPRIASLDEKTAFQRKFFDAVYGSTLAGMDPQQATTLAALLPGLQRLSGAMSAEGDKLQGTPLSTTIVVDGVKSPEQMKEASEDSGGGGGFGGLGGRLARRMTHKGEPQQRTTALTMTHDVLSVATTVDAADLAIPAGFKDKTGK